jgi:hypothetical protein
MRNTIFRITFCIDVIVPTSDQPLSLLSASQLEFSKTFLRAPCNSHVQNIFTRGVYLQYAMKLNMWRGAFSTATSLRRSALRHPLWPVPPVGSVLEWKVLLSKFAIDPHFRMTAEWRSMSVLAREEACPVSQSSHGHFPGVVLLGQDAPT